MQKISQKDLQRSAFTMLELVFVIVVIGIISAVAFSRSDSDRAREAAVQVLSHIRYAQHLAMLDDKFDSVNGVNLVGNEFWFNERWQILFQQDNGGNNNWVYLIFSDTNRGGGPNNNEIAVDPSSGQQLTGNTNTSRTESMDLTTHYGINNIAFADGCAGVQRIVFDHLGRPYTTASSLSTNIMTTQCNITFTHQDGSSFVIEVMPETGYSRIR